MQVLSTLAEIDPWIRDEGGCDAEVSLCIERSPRETFLVAYATFTTRFGAPDYPNGDAGLALRASLRFRAEAMLAIWDFDDYRLSLRLEDVDGETAVFVGRHGHMSRSAPRTSYERGRDELIASFEETAVVTADEARELDAAWNVSPKGR